MCACSTIESYTKLRFAREWPFFQTTAPALALAPASGEALASALALTLAAAQARIYRFATEGGIFERSVGPSPIDPLKGSY